MLTAQPHYPSDWISVEIQSNSCHVSPLSCLHHGINGWTHLFYYCLLPLNTNPCCALQESILKTIFLLSMKLWQVHFTSSVNAILSFLISKVLLIISAWKSHKKISRVLYCCCSCRALRGEKTVGGGCLYVFMRSWKIKAPTQVVHVLQICPRKQSENMKKKLPAYKNTFTHLK